MCSKLPPGSDQPFPETEAQGAGWEMQVWNTVIAAGGFGALNTWKVMRWLLLQTHEWKHLPGNDHWQQGWPQAKAAKPAPLVSLMQPLKDWCCWRKDCGFSLILAQESLADPSSAEPVMEILSSVPLG